jgi:hypothetical protein
VRNNTELAILIGKIYGIGNFLWKNSGKVPWKIENNQKIVILRLDA